MKKVNAKKVALENPFVKEDDADDRTLPKVPYPVHTDYEQPDPTKIKKP